jgi:hypothetical protein
VRDKMPNTAWFVDWLRSAIGPEAAMDAMKLGTRDGSFFAIENGHVWGTPTRQAFERCGLEAPADAPEEDVGYPAITGSIRRD